MRSLMCINYSTILRVNLIIFLSIFVGYAQENIAPIPTGISVQPEQENIGLNPPINLPDTDSEMLNSSNSCHHMVIGLNYLAQIALVSEAVLQVDIDNVESCISENGMIYPQRQNYYLMGRQVPLVFNITCAIGGTVHFQVFETNNSVASFVATETCDVLASNYDQQHTDTAFPNEVMLSTQVQMP